MCCVVCEPVNTVVHKHRQTCRLQSYFQYKNRHVCLSVCLTCWQRRTAHRIAKFLRLINRSAFKIETTMLHFIFEQTLRYRTDQGPPLPSPREQSNLQQHYFPFLLNSRRQTVRRNWVIPRDPVLSKQLNPSLTQYKISWPRNLSSIAGKTKRWFSSPSLSERLRVLAHFVFQRLPRVKGFGGGGDMRNWTHVQWRWSSVRVFLVLS